MHCSTRLLATSLTYRYICPRGRSPRFQLPGGARICRTNVLARTWSQHPGCVDAKDESVPNLLTLTPTAIPRLPYVLMMLSDHVMDSSYPEDDSPYRAVCTGVLIH